MMTYTSHQHDDFTQIPNRQRLENLRQGNLSAEETFNAMQVAMARANVAEDEETTMASDGSSGGFDV